MMRSLYTGVSGMSNHQTRMDVLSNNIANVNTIGYKGSRTVFSDTLSQTMQGATAPRENVGGINAKQIGLGAKTASIDILFTKTSFQTTNVNTDLAINNNGFFIVNNGAQSYYTRAGNFYFDQQGNFVTNEGLHVMGWMADVNGTVNDAAPIEPLKMPVTATMDPKITTYMNYTGNLGADEKLGSAKSTSKDIYDSQGYDHRVSTMYTKLGDNKWLAYSSVTGVQDGTNVQGNTKLVEFDAYGKLISTSDANIAGSSTPAIFLTGFSSSITLNPNLVAGVQSNIYNSNTHGAPGITFTDSDGNNHVVDLLIDVVSGSGGASNDTIYEVKFSVDGGTPITHQFSAANSGYAWPTFNATLANGDIFTFNPNTQLSFVDGATTNPPTVNFVQPTRVLGGAIGNAFNAPGIELSDYANLNDFKEGVIAFTDPATGIARAIAVKATCTAGPQGTTPATWKLEFIENGKVVGGQTYSGSGALPTITLTDGTMYTFQGASVNYVTTPNPTDLNIQEVVTAGTNNQLSFQPAGGTANPLTVNTDYSAMTQYAGGYNLGDPQQDGYAAGTLEEKIIDASGMITGKFSNGQILNLGQIAMAIFNNQQGLERAGSTLFITSNNSGDPIIGTAGTGGRGTMQAGAVEMSNVDLAEEFTNMIVTQRGYQSNSRIITTSDELLQELINLKR